MTETSMTARYAGMNGAEVTLMACDLAEPFAAARPSQREAFPRDGALRAADASPGGRGRRAVVSVPQRPHTGRRDAGMPLLLLVDYSSLLYRAWHSLPESVPMHGVLGFLNMLARLLVDRTPGRCAIVVDDDWRPAFRVDAIPAYKAHRVAEAGEEDPVAPQEEVGREVLAAIGFAVVGARGFEAEDVIATIAGRTRGRIEVVSGDRDLFAIVRDPDGLPGVPGIGGNTAAQLVAR